MNYPQSISTIFVIHGNKTEPIFDDLTSSKSMSLSPVAVDVKRALDSVFFPLEIEVWEDSISAENGHMIDYTPPFFLNDKCNEMNFGVYFQGEMKYPLVCHSTGEYIQPRTFTVQNADDWINHAPSFVTWHGECVELMDKFAARKK